jgi:hypothetical protein
MKVIRNWENLREFGIICLTGEACILGARALCDLTPAGQTLVREYLGLPYNSGFTDAWNTEGTGSMFIPWDCLPSLAAFVLIKSGCHCAIHVAQDGIYGIEPGDDKDRINDWLATVGVQRRYGMLAGHPRAGLSAVHAITGRAQ